jgi:hypothetical protein
MRATLIIVMLAAAAVSAFTAPAQAAPVKWRVFPVLLMGDNKGPGCGYTGVDKFDLEIDGDMVRTTAWSSTAYEMRLLKPLNPDGSGKVPAWSIHRNRPVTLDFDAGTGPRIIRYMGPYSICVWEWRPI